MRVIEKISSAAWDEISQRCPYATYFHTRYWTEFIENTFYYKNVTKGFYFDNGVQTIFPLMLKKNARFSGRFLDEYISGPLYVYGGPISDGKLSKQQTLEISEYLNSSLRSYRSILIRGNPFSKDVVIPGYREVPDKSHIVELYKYQNERDLLKSYSKGQKQHINKAKGFNLIIREARKIEEFEE